MFFFRKPEISFTSRLVHTYGQEKIADVFFFVIACKFSRNLEVKYCEMLQFLREEADAAQYGNEYARKFAESLFEDRSDYDGAMNEEAEYPIDGPGGPQQTLLKIILPVVGEDGELAVRLRCAIVRRVADFKCLVFMMLNQQVIGVSAVEDHASCLKLMATFKESETFLTELMEKYPDEMKSLLF